MTYSYACDGTPVSNPRSLNQTRDHYNRNGDEKSDRDPARDHSSHPFCGPRHLCVSSHGHSPLLPCPFGLFTLFPFCLSPPSPFDLSPSPCALSHSPARSSRLRSSSSSRLARLVSSSAFFASSASFPLLAALEYDF